jgi:hypothetical protein
MVDLFKKTMEELTTYKTVSNMAVIKAVVEEKVGDWLHTRLAEKLLPILK